MSWPLFGKGHLKGNSFLLHVCICAESFQSCLTLCDPMDCSPPGSSAHGMLQSRILEWFAMPSSRGFSPPRNRTHVSYKSCTGGRFFATRATWESLCISSHHSLKDMQVAAVILTWKSDSCSPRNEMAFTEGLVMVYYGLPELIIAISQMLLIFDRDFSSNGILVVSWYTWIWWCLCIRINCYVIFIVSE